MASYRALKQIHLSDPQGRSRLVAEGEEFEARAGLKGKSIVCLDAPNRQVKTPKAKDSAPDASKAQQGRPAGDGPGALA